MRLLLIFSYFKTVATLVNYTSKSFIKLTTAVFEFKRSEFFTSHRGYLLNTTFLIPGVGFSVSGLDCAKFGFCRFESFLFIVVMVSYLKL